VLLVACRLSPVRTLGKFTSYESSYWSTFLWRKFVKSPLAFFANVSKSGSDDGGGVVVGGEYQDVHHR